MLVIFTNIPLQKTERNATLENETKLNHLKNKWMSHANKILAKYNNVSPCFS